MHLDKMQYRVYTVKNGVAVWEPLLSNVFITVDDFTEIFSQGLRVFSNGLENQGQSFLLYKQLGKLFAYSPSDADGAFPHEVIRDKIEKIGNEELINSFASTIIYGRVVYTLTGGKDEYLLAQKYGELSKRFAVRYPKTSKIFNIISRHYLNESEHDRKIAESDVY